jgi:hypothetical protein
LSAAIEVEREREESRRERGRVERERREKEREGERKGRAGWERCCLSTASSSVGHMADDQMPLPVIFHE